MKKQFAFSLVELLAVSSIAVLLCALSGRLFVDGITETRRIHQHADTAQLTLILMQQWQKTIHTTTPDTWVVAPDKFSAGPDCAILQVSNHLVIIHHAATNRFALPQGMTCIFAREHGPGNSDLAVLTLNIPAPTRKTSESIRLVACQRSTPL